MRIAPTTVSGFRPVVALVFAGVAVFVLSSCGSPSPSPTASDGTTWQLTAQPQTVSEYGQDLVDCLRSKGWEAKLTPDEGPGSWYTDVPPAQHDQYLADAQTCQDALPKLQDPSKSETLMRKMYDMTAVQNTCLLDKGYSVAEAPSYAAWSDVFRSEGAARWDPLGDVSQRDRAEAERACPSPDYPLH